MDAATTDIIKSRARPLLDEVFDAYVIIGFHTDSNGVRSRIVIHNTGARNVVEMEGQKVDVGPKDSALFDAIEPVVEIARNWGRSQR